MRFDRFIAANRNRIAESEDGWLKYYIDLVQRFYRPTYTSGFTAMRPRANNGPPSSLSIRGAPAKASRGA